MRALIVLILALGGVATAAERGAPRGESGRVAGERCFAADPVAVPVETHRVVVDPSRRPDESAGTQPPNALMTPELIKQLEREFGFDRRPCYAFVGVTAITMESPAVIENATVVGDGDRIVGVSPSSEVELAERVLRIDTGGYLMPGLADMHVHVNLEEHLWLYLANGITTIRNMWGLPLHREWQARIDSGDLVAPTIYTVGPLMDGPGSYWPMANVLDDVEVVPDAVGAVAAAGFPALKVYNELSVDVYEALVRHGHAQGLRIEGHVPNAVGISRVIDAGQYANEHLSGFERATINRDLMPRYGEMDWRSRQRELGRLARGVNDGTLDLDDVHDPEILASLARRMATAGLWNIPTLVLFTGRDDPRTRAAMRFLDPFTKSSWRDDPNVAADRRAIESVWHRYRLSIVRALEAAGAPWLVGTDAPNPFVVPGFAIHQELDNLFEAGLSRERILRAATRDAAQFIGVDDVGTIAVGQRADLVLLADDPLEDFETLSRPTGVMVRGGWLPRVLIDKKLAEIESRWAAFEAPGTRPE